MSVYEAKKEKFDTILALVGKMNVLEMERLIALMCVEFGMAELTVGKMVRTLIHAGKLDLDGGMVKLSESAKHQMDVKKAFDGADKVLADHSLAEPVGKSSADTGG